MSEKVKLPREVTEAIEILRDEGYSDFDIIKGALEGDSVILRDWVFDSWINGEKLLAALVNGYEIEKTPEELEAERPEKVRELFARYAKQASASPYEEYDPSAVQVIIQTLNILGIKIEGVND